MVHLMVLFLCCEYLIIQLLRIVIPNLNINDTNPSSREFIQNYGDSDTRVLNH